jgi:hypothetical protein
MKKTTSWIIGVIAVLVLIVAGAGIYRFNFTDGGDVVPPTTKLVEYKDLIKVSSLFADEKIISPLIIKGEARGGWYFEGSFPVVLTDWDGAIIAQGVAQADGEWMTTEFVPFTATLKFAKPSYGDRGFLILKNDNPSDLRQYDDSLEIPILFK